MSRNTSNVEMGDVLGIVYESVHGSTSAEHSEILTVVEAGYDIVAENRNGEMFTITRDGDTATELAKHDKFDNPRRVGYVDKVTRMGWA